MINGRSIVMGLSSSLMMTFVLLLSSVRAIACPEGQDEACAFRVCACVPNGGTVVTALNPIPDILTTAGGVIHGNIHEISQGVGALVIKGNCAGCAVAAHTVLSSNDKAFVERMVGRGWLVFINTGSPSLVFADAATSVAKEYALTHPPVNPLQPPPPAARGVKSYKVPGALCAVKSEGITAAAGWVDAPVLTNASGASFTFPGVDLQPGDTLDVVAANQDCVTPPAGQTALKTLVMKYNYPSTPPNANPKGMKGVLIGDYLSGG